MSLITCNNLEVQHWRDCLHAVAFAELMYCWFFQWFSHGTEKSAFPVHLLCNVSFVQLIQKQWDRRITLCLSLVGSWLELMFFFSFQTFHRWDLLKRKSWSFLHGSLHQWCRKQLSHVTLLTYWFAGVGEFTCTSGLLFSTLMKTGLIFYSHTVFTIVNTEE